MVTKKLKNDGGWMVGGGGRAQEGGVRVRFE